MSTDFVMYQHLYWLCFASILLYLAFDTARISMSAKFFVYIPLLVLLAFTLANTVEQFDIGTYRRIFYRLDTAPDEWRVDMFPEFGYQYLNYILNGVWGWNFEQFRFLFAFVVLCILFFSVSRLTNHHGLFFLLYYPKYYLIGLISHTRSGLTNAFIFLTIDMAARSQYIRIAILSLVLMQFHFSAILLNGISILSKIKVRQIYILGAIPAAIAFGQLILPFLMESAGLFDLRQLNYLAGDDLGDRSLFGVEFIRRSMLILVCAYIVGYKKMKNPAEALVIQVFVASIFVYIGFHEARFISDRVGGMLGFVEPMMWIIFMQNHVFPTNKMLAYVLVVLYALLDFSTRAIVLDDLPGHPEITRFISVLAGM